METCLDCCFEYEGKKHDAVIIDISLNGAYLSSRFLPPSGRIVRVVVKVPGAGTPIVLEGPVTRISRGMTEYGITSRFGMEFPSPPLQLSEVISALVSGKMRAGR
jgi:hypothetical protein